MASDIQHRQPLSEDVALRQRNRTTLSRRFIGLFAEVVEPILEILHGVKTVFTRLAITPPKENRFGWNLEQCEQNVGLALADPRSSDSLGGIVFLKNAKIVDKIFQVLRLQAVITPQWLQIAGNSLPNGSSTGCLVSFFTVRVNSKSFLWDVRSVQKGTYPNFRQRPISDILRIKTNSTLQCWCGLASDILKKSTLNCRKFKISNMTDNAGII